MKKTAVNHFFNLISHSACACVRVHVCACMRACVRVHVCACVCVRVCVGGREGGKILHILRSFSLYIPLWMLKDKNFGLLCVKSNKE